MLKIQKIWFLSQDLLWEKSWENRDWWDEKQLSPKVTQTVERLDEIKHLLETGEWDPIALIQEQGELIEWMITNEAYQKYDLQIEILKYFWFSNEQLHFPISKLSWGEQTKVQIAKFLLQDVDLLILDEPTNHSGYWGHYVYRKFCQMRNKSFDLYFSW